MWGSNPFTSYSSQPFGGFGQQSNSGSFNSGALNNWGGDPSQGYQPWMSPSGYGNSGGMQGGSSYQGGSQMQMPPWMGGGMGGGSMMYPGNTGGLGYGGMGGYQGFPSQGYTPQNNGGGYMQGGMNPASRGGPVQQQQPQQQFQPQPGQQYGPPNMNTPSTDYYGSTPSGGSGGGLPDVTNQTTPWAGQSTGYSPQELASGQFSPNLANTMLQGTTASMMGYGNAPWQGAQYSIQQGKWV